jgi:hypothetical protein
MNGGREGMKVWGGIDSRRTAGAVCPRDGQNKKFGVNGYRYPKFERVSPKMSAMNTIAML